MNEFYERLDNLIAASPLANFTAELPIISERRYRPLRSRIGLEMLSDWKKTITHRDRNFFFAVELAALSFYLTETAIAKKDGKKEKALHLLAADGLLTMAYRSSGDYLSRLTELVDTMLRGRLLLLDLARHKRRFLILEKIVELSYGSGFRAVTGYAAARAYPNSELVEISGGLGSMLGLCYYLEAERGDEITMESAGVSVKVGMSEILGRDFAGELNDDLRIAIEEYRDRLRLPPRLIFPVKD